MAGVREGQGQLVFGLDIVSLLHPQSREGIDIFLRDLVVFVEALLRMRWWTDCTRLWNRRICMWRI